MSRAHGFLLALMLLTAGVYGHGLWTAGFVWDDIPLIVMNQQLGRLDAIPMLFTEDLWAASGAGDVQSGYYRPLVLLSFSLDKALFGDVALGYHLHSLGWHLVAVLALYILLRDILGEGRALLGVTLFALHPVQSECVAWISARNDLMAAALGMLAIVALQGRGRSAVRWWLAVMLAAGAVLSKESAVLIPLLYWVLDRCRAPGDRAGQGMQALITGIGIALGLRMLAGVGGAVMPPQVGWELVAERFTDWVGIMTASVALPASVASARDLHWTDIEPSARIWLGWGVVCLSVLVASLHQGIVRRAAAGGLLWVVVGMALTVVPMADKGGYGDRFWYLPLVGVCLLIAAVTPRRWSAIIAAAVALPAVVSLHVRLPDWKDDAHMWAAAARDVPSPMNHVGLGHAMARSGRLQRAHVAFAGALGTDRIVSDACTRLVGSAARMGRPAHAVRMGRWAIARGCPWSGEFTGWMAASHAMYGDWEGAESTLDSAEEDPKGRGLVVRAAIFLRGGDQEAYERAVAGRPELASQVQELLRGAATQPAP